MLFVLYIYKIYIYIFVSYMLFVLYIYKIYIYIYIFVSYMLFVLYIYKITFMQPAKHHIRHIPTKIKLPDTF